ncbi:MAG: hypothetical protein K6B69_11050 [Lachnospiraceae bacterium]|nr:hypothetical protein [Lachnospiraceae bacterium]
MIRNHQLLARLEKLMEKVTQLRALADQTNDVSFAVGSVYCTGDYDINNAIQEADVSGQESVLRKASESRPEKKRRMTLRDGAEKCKNRICGYH